MTGQWLVYGDMALNLAWVASVRITPEGAIHISHPLAAWAGGEQTRFDTDLWMLPNHPDYPAARAAVDAFLAKARGEVAS